MTAASERSLLLRDLSTRHLRRKSIAHCVSPTRLQNFSEKKPTSGTWAVLLLVWAIAANVVYCNHSERFSNQRRRRRAREFRGNLVAASWPDSIDSALDFVLSLRARSWLVALGR